MTPRFLRFVDIYFYAFSILNTLAFFFFRLTLSEKPKGLARPIASFVVSKRREARENSRRARRNSPGRGAVQRDARDERGGWANGERARATDGGRGRGLQESCFLEKHARRLGKYRNRAINASSRGDAGRAGR
jgi:hypothetical protein